MARLNEPPAVPAPSAEAFDAVKRKFMRTNRELAKINSQQQVHIRTLENERSRLVAENCALAQQVLHLQNTLEAQAHAPSFSAIDTVKSQLDAKIQELGGLVAELGQLNQRDGNVPSKTMTATKKSPDERQWRSALGLQEVENGMLPTITEYKAYPRRTMNAEELQDILNAPDSQSPDIGPPPVSHFGIEEPIAFNNNTATEAQPDTPFNDEEPALPMNLETRRKRRESGPRISARRMSLFESPPDAPEEALAKVVRTGAKRKFSVQQDEEKEPLADAFQFNRRNTPTPAEDETGDEDSRALSPKRPILSSKPVNTDPVVSPKKQRSSATEKSEKPDKKKTARPRLSINRNGQPELLPPEVSDPIPTAEIHLESLPPKTPAAEAIFSPPSTEPSTSRPESKDTPPPGDLMSISQTGIIGRPSRRARPQVSYKEPSLNTKMRRPGKELVDAVISEHSRRTSVDPPSTAPHITIKEEPEDSPWKPLGAVAGIRGGDAAELGSPLRQKLDRKEGSQDAKPDRPKLNSLAASQAISAMIEETSTAKRKSLSSAGILSAREMADEPRSQSTKDTKLKSQVAGSESDLAIFDFNESSPVANSAATTNARPKITLASAVRQGRRHSSVPTSSASEERKPEASVKTDGTLPAVHKRTGSGSAKLAPAAGLAKSTAAARSSMKEREKRASALPSSGSAADLKSRVEGGTEVAREGRTTSRRKSMMI